LSPSRRARVADDRCGAALLRCDRHPTLHDPDPEHDSPTVRRRGRARVDHRVADKRRPRSCVGESVLLSTPGPVKGKCVNASKGLRAAQSVSSSSELAVLRINVTESYVVAEWSRRLGCTPGELRAT